MRELGRLNESTVRTIAVRTELCDCNDVKMASVTFGIVSSKGKENELPPVTTTATATVKKCKKSALQRCGSLSSNNERRSDLAGPTGQRESAIAETLSSLKEVSFQVHCDDKNEQQPKPQPQVRPRRDCITTSKPRAPLRDNGDKKPAPGVQGTGEKLSRERLTDQSRKNKNQLPSKIPRPGRSISSGSGEQKPRSCGDENAAGTSSFPRTRSSSLAGRTIILTHCQQLLLHEVLFKQVDASS